MNTTIAEEFYDLDAITSDPPRVINQLIVLAFEEFALWRIFDCLNAQESDDAQ